MARRKHSIYFEGETILVTDLLLVGWKYGLASPGPRRVPPLCNSEAWEYLRRSYDG